MLVIPLGQYRIIYIFSMDEQNSLDVDCQLMKPPK